MLSPVRRNRPVDRSRELVPERLGITVGVRWSVDCVPPLELIARAPTRTEHLLEQAELTHRPHGLPFSRATERPLRHRELAIRKHERVRVLVDVHELITTKIDRVGLQDPRTAEEIRMLKL